MVEQSGENIVVSHDFTYGGQTASCAKAFEAPRIDKETNNIPHARQITPAVKTGSCGFEIPNLVDEMRGAG